MAKAAITKKFSLNANGILSIEDGVIGLEVTDTGEMIDLCTLLADFNGKSVKLGVTYDYDYVTDEE